MNEKLKKFSYASILPAKEPPKRRRLIGLRTTEPKKGTFLWRISLPGDLAKKTAIEPGDSLTFEFDEGEVHLHLCDPKDPGARQISKMRGRRVVTFRLPENLLPLFYDRVANEVEVDEGRIAFSLGLK